MNLAYISLKKSITLSLNTVKENTSNQTNDDNLKDEEFAYFIKKFKKFFRNGKRASER